MLNFQSALCYFFSLFLSFIGNSLKENLQMIFNFAHLSFALERGSIGSIFRIYLQVFSHRSCQSEKYLLRKICNYFNFCNIKDCYYDHYCSKTFTVFSILIQLQFFSFHFVFSSLILNFKFYFMHNSGMKMDFMFYGILVKSSIFSCLSPLSSTILTQVNEKILKWNFK